MPFSIFAASEPVPRCFSFHSSRQRSTRERGRARARHHKTIRVLWNNRNFWLCATTRSNPPSRMQTMFHRHSQTRLQPHSVQCEFRRITIARPGLASLGGPVAHPRSIADPSGTTPMNSWRVRAVAPALRKYKRGSEPCGSTSPVCLRLSSPAQRLPPSAGTPAHPAG